MAPVSGALCRGWDNTYSSQEIYELSTKVEEVFPQLELPDFPSRIVFDFWTDGFDPGVVEKRRSGLELYLRALVARPHVFASPVVSGFFRLLEPLSPSDLPPALATPLAANQSRPPAPLSQTVASGRPAPNLAHSVFLLPPAPLRRIPDIVLLPPNQEECFASSMMDAVKQTLQMLSSLRTEIETAPDVVAKLQAYENWRDRIEPRIRQLQEHIYLVLRISNNLHPVEHRQLSGYFVASLEVMRSALQWAQGIEESLFRMLDSDAPAPHSPTPPPLRNASPPSVLRTSTGAIMPVSDFGFVPAPIPPSTTPTSAELPVNGLSAYASPSIHPALPHEPFTLPAAAALSSMYPADVAQRLSTAPPASQLPDLGSMPPPSPARNHGDLPARVKAFEDEGESLLVRAVEEGDAAVQPAVDSLREKLQREIQACTGVPGLEEFAQRCVTARSYMDDNLALIRRLRTVQGADEVERYETELFRLLHLSASISPTDIAESTTLRNGLLKLMRELAVYKGMTQKRQAPEAVPVLRRLEDLQENVATFEAEVTLKFGWERGFADRAKELLKSKQIAEAKKEHENIADNIYEL